MVKQSAMLACAGGLLLMGCHRTKTLADYGPAERPFIQRAVDGMTVPGRQSREDVFKRYDPVVVWFPRMVCVGMHLRKGIAGGDSTVCYDRAGRKVASYAFGD